MKYTPTATNVKAVFDLATQDQLRAGTEWYREANDLARELDPNDHRRAAGVIAAMSPLTPWGRNKDLARKAYRDGKASGTLSRSADKANKILSGQDPLDVLSGDKVRAFYAAIVDPDKSDNVVIDRHAFDVAIGQRTDDQAKTALRRKGVYDQFVAAYLDAADDLGVSAVALQAITWLVWRDQHLTDTKYEWILEGDRK